MRKLFVLLVGILSFATAMAEEGVVILHQDSIMETLLVKKEVAEKNVAITAVGYRVQVYSNNNARKAKADAFELEEKLVELFPEVKCYVTYSAPFWKVRLGDFPKLANEIIVIKENNTKPLYLDDNKTLPEAE